MRCRPAAGLVASLLVHGALVTGVLLVVPRSEVLPALFIDLTEDADARDGAEASRVERPVPARARARAAPTASDRLASRADDGAAAALAPAPPAPSPVMPAREQPAPGPMAPVEPEPLSTASPAATVAPPERAAPELVSGSEPTATAAETTTAVPSGAVPLAAAEEAREPKPSVGPGEPGRIGHRQAVARDETATPDSHAVDAAAGLGARAGQGLALASPGSGPAEAGTIYADYLAGLRQRIHEALRYPASARRRGLSGTVTIEVTVLPDGAIGPVRVVESSSHPLLDEAAVESARTLSRQPFPRDLPARTLRVRLPVVFELR